jgi:KDO2-lipid IV(A) lauroyltransferase
MQRRKKKITVKHRLEYLLFMAFILLIKASPLFMVKFNRKLLRFIFGLISKRHHGIVEKNLTIAFPDETKERISELKEAIYSHFSAILVEIIYMFIKKKPGKILKPVEITDFHYLEEALKKQKGVILFSAHFGNWELIPYILNRKLNKKINSIARQMDNPLVEKKVKQFREYMGSAVIYKKNAVRTMLNRLKNNGIVYLLIDQHAIRREAVYVDFFGRTVRALPSVSQLHIRKDIPVVPVFLHYEEDKIVLEVLEEINMSGSGDRAADIRRLTQLCTSIIEEKVRQYPEQWFWFHNRWKTDPAAGAGDEVDEVDPVDRSSKKSSKKGINNEDIGGNR